MHLLSKTKAKEIPNNNVKRKINGHKNERKPDSFILQMEKHTVLTISKDICQMTDRINGITYM